MNFFEHQDRARRSTTRLVFLFIFAVLAIITALNLAAYAIARGVGVHEGVRHLSSPTYERVQPLWSNAGMYQWVTVGTLVTILSGTLYKTVQLRKGGAAVAQMLGGTPLIPNSGTPADRQLQNIVEEMSIASGVPVPQVYVMRNEPGINAFAAGFGPQDAVISVTQGCIDQLNRDELQGVIAHEFSHILNGDMRLNLRLIGILHGILLIALIGYFVLRSMFSSSSSSSSRRSSSKDGDGGPWIALIIGLALVAIGYIGVFFGRLIQAAVSRQREFLADASAVQFTRNPSGIANALKKIAAASAGSQVDNAQALGTAHLFFASAFRVGFVNLLATHPPLVDRIKAIDPTFDGKLPLGGAATEVLDESSVASRGAVLAGMLADSTIRPRIRTSSREVVERA
ncbi:MAG TPA: M48 family metallopeptidase, partial [Tepidisphaeraceae bacterium]|nr:M48 family metallopeptidase [Tepidisphaeraceae bacterium]